MFGFGGGRLKEQVFINNNGGVTFVEQRRNGLFGPRQEVIVQRNPFGGTTVIQQKRGLFGRKQEVIVERGGFGGGTTIIQQRNGIFGPRQQIIINNRPNHHHHRHHHNREQIIVTNNGNGNVGGYGVGGGIGVINTGGGNSGGYGVGGTTTLVNNPGFGGNTTIVEQRRGIFGPNELIEVNNVGFGMRGGNTTIIEEQRGLFGNKEQIIVNNNRGFGMGGNTTIIQQNRGIFGPREEVIINNNGGFGMNNGVTINAVIPTPQVVLPVSQVTVQPQYNQPQQNPYTNSNQSNPYSTTQTQNNQQNDVQVLLNQKMLILKNQKQWQGPINLQLTQLNFYQFNMNSVRKIKCRTNFQPFSNVLTHGEVIIKVVVGFQDMYFAASPQIVGNYFCKIILIKSKWSNIPQMMVFENEVSGYILKKGGIFGGWQQFFVKITKQQGLQLYKNINDSPNLHIKKTKQIWTWFQIVQGKYLVIKLKNGMSKVQLGIPINQCREWLAGLYSLLDNYQ